MQGKNNISAKIVQSSLNYHGQIIRTYELEYPRFIHSEFMTHRMFSRNAASSRAVPFNKMVDHVMNKPAIPVFFGINQPGMTAAQEVSEKLKPDVTSEWLMARKIAVDSAKFLFDRYNLHKQLVNRITEPFQMMKTVVTATEWSNFFALRLDPGAQPEIRELADCMLKAAEQELPLPIFQGEWHVPYVERRREYGNLVYGDYYTTDIAKKVSASLCAQVSYRTSDFSVEKALAIYSKLIDSAPVHASPVEHQATQMEQLKYMGPERNWEPGVTHADREGYLWSGNFKGWIQNRQLIPNHYVG